MHRKIFFKKTFYLIIFIETTAKFCFIGIGFIFTIFRITSFSSRFYRNLNLDACLWSFENFYDMSELVEDCGGRIVTDGHVKDAVQSHLSIDVPLHVSYVYHSSTDEDGWTDFNHHSSFRLTAVYDTGILWENGVALPEKARLQGKLHPASIIIRKRDKRLQVNFRTKARFRGMFILTTRGNYCLISVIFILFIYFILCLQLTNLHWKADIILYTNTNSYVLIIKKTW